VLVQVKPTPEFTRREKNTRPNPTHIRVRSLSKGAK